MTNKPDIWRSYSQLIFDKNDILWLLLNLVELRSGAGWPIQPGVTKGEPTGKKPAPAPQAHYEKAIIAAAELDRRLDACKIDGLLTELFYTHKVDEAVLGARLGKSFQEITSRIAACLKHIEGRRFKGHGYQRGNFIRRNKK